MEEMETMTVDVDVAEEGTAYDTETAESSETEEATAVVDTPAEDNSPKGEKSSRFANYRRREEMERLNNETSNLRAKNTEYENRIAAMEERERRLNELLGNYYEGDDLEGRMLSMEAQIKGVPIADLQAQRAETAAQMKAEQEKADELAYYKGIVQKMQMEEAQKMYDADLAAVKALDPAVNSLEELGEEFERLRFTKNPLTNEFYSVSDVYNHIKSKIKPLPQTSGTVNTTAEENKEVDFMKVSAETFEEMYNKIVYGG